MNGLQGAGSQVGSKFRRTWLTATGRSEHSGGGAGRRERSGHGARTSEESVKLARKLGRSPYYPCYNLGQWSQPETCSPQRLHGRCVAGRGLRRGGGFPRHPRLFPEIKAGTRLQTEAGRVRAEFRGNLLLPFRYVLDLDCDAQRNREVDLRQGELVKDSTGGWRLQPRRAGRGGIPGDPTDRSAVPGFLLRKITDILVHPVVAAMFASIEREVGRGDRGGYGGRKSPIRSAHHREHRGERGGHRVRRNALGMPELVDSQLTVAVQHSYGSGLRHPCLRSNPDLYY